MRVALLAFTLACLCVPAVADSVVVPNANAAVEAPARLNIPFAPASATDFQWQLAASQFAGVAAGSQFTAIGFRLDGGEPTGPSSAATYSNWQLTLASAVNPLGGLSATVAANMGADALVVRSGQLVIPMNSLIGGAGPNPFFVIAFDTPYVYQGGDVVLLLTHTGRDVDRLTSFFADARLRGDGIGDTAFGGLAGFFNYPVTWLQYTAAEPVPEPATWILLALGCFAVARRRRRA